MGLVRHNIRMVSPSPHELLTMRLAIVREDLEEVLTRLNEEMMSWAPREGMRTIGGQLVEIAGTELQIVIWMREERQASYEEVTNFGEQSLAGMKEILQSVRGETLSYMNSLSEDGLTDPAPFPERWFESLRLSHAPRAEAFRSIAAHEWYHTGQLVSYLWARGDDPYQW